MLALMYEAKTHDIEILAITTTYGNTYIENVEQNVLKILTIANRSDVSISTHTHARRERERERRKKEKKKEIDLRFMFRFAWYTYMRARAHICFIYKNYLFFCETDTRL